MRTFLYSNCSFTVLGGYHIFNGSSPSSLTKCFKQVKVMKKKAFDAVGLEVGTRLFGVNALLVCFSNSLSATPSNFNE